MCVSYFGFCQLATDFDEILPFNDDLAAVKKDHQWGFISKKGDLVIDFRNDFVLTKGEKGFSPEFNDKRCLIKRLKNGVYFYGFINEQGNEIIPATYLNASNFENGYALVVVHLQDSIGYNKVLKKALRNSKIEEYIIDTSGEIIKYLENPINYTLPKNSHENPPKLRSKFIAPHRVAVLKKDMKWDIYEF
ncbi:WG repeat-containing protein [Lutibacter holmesii]|uniref:WG repeat-containing protein n=2 Tax=Lutibacter holmesii TaxID=1137985 RepID=A0ABW3WJH2_9FLAO